MSPDTFYTHKYDTVYMVEMLLHTQYYFSNKYKVFVRVKFPSEDSHLRPFFSADTPITVDKFCSLNYIKDDNAAGVQLISHLATTDRSKDYHLSTRQGCSCCPSESSRRVLIALSTNQSVAGGCDNL